MPSDKRIPRNLKRARKNARLSQAQVATAIDCGRDQISDYERGIKQPMPDRLVKLATVLRVSLDVLMTGTVRDTTKGE